MTCGRNYVPSGEKMMSIQSEQTPIVADVMMDAISCPTAHENTIFKEVLEEMDIHRLGVVCVVDSDGFLLGLLTEGDVRRKLLRVQKPLAALLADDVIIHSIQSPVTITVNASLLEAVNLMEERKIWDLPVVDAERRLIGLLHLHQAIKGLLTYGSEEKSDG